MRFLEAREGAVLYESRQGDNLVYIVRSFGESKYFATYREAAEFLDGHVPSEELSH
jgi:hypothetical protein